MPGDARTLGVESWTRVAACPRASGHTAKMDQIWLSARALSLSYSWTFWVLTWTPQVRQMLAQALKKSPEGQCVSDLWGPKHQGPDKWSPDSSILFRVRTHKKGPRVYGGHQRVCNPVAPAASSYVPKA